MSAYRFIAAPPPSTGLDAWTALGDALGRWVRAHGGSPMLADLAQQVCEADGKGDTALFLAAAADTHDGLPACSAEELDSLRAQPLVAADDTGAPRPFVLDEAGRFYLWRNRRDETCVIEALRARRAAATPEPLSEADLDRLFDGRNDAAVAPQRQAVQQVGGRRLFVLTGGPGTGKTTTVLRMLLRLQHAAAATLTMALAAPTGKAAQRLAQSLRQGRDSLLAANLPEAWRIALAQVPESAQTLHRLLGYQRWNGGFVHHGGNRLPADVVVVDEASMVDLSLLRALLDALRPETALILVGDADQLASVGAGSALMDLAAVLEAQDSGDLVRLRHSFRAQQALTAVHESVRVGDKTAFEAAWQVAGATVREHAVPDRQALARVLRHWSAELATHQPATCSNPADARAALRALSGRQLLCALREGSFGAPAVAAAIERALRKRWHVPESDVWYPGRAVVVVRNDYAAGLFNGDVGLCLADPDGRLQVWFESDDEAGVRALAPEALLAHESAFAITVHRSQGSEYAHVAVLLPPTADSPILTRQLLYTALSRARQRIELWCTQGSLDAALQNSVRRAGGLAERMRTRA
ncbi:MAG: exodeoxyribonuclease V subunit alpha [Proteobacteria bacterium]|nr:exodeoxyribonuclease V subunit alpha [Pseudomonadota bacterium]